MLIGNKVFDVENETYVMGILNVTPDSFSDGGKFNQMDAALSHVEEMLAEGMDILDIGGESTRPGYQIMPWEEEAERVIPFVEAIRKRFDVPISLDTYKAGVAREGILAGADLINDIWGCKFDPDMAKVIAEGDVSCCLMHNRQEPNYKEFVPDMLKDLEECVQIATAAGVAKEKIILDPGVGFGKTYENNLEAIATLEQVKKLGYPVLLGCSRKSVIGNTLSLPVNERLEGTLVTSVYAVQKGCAFVRVHDVKENKRAILMAKAIEEYTHGLH